MKPQFLPVYTMFLIGKMKAIYNELSVEPIIALYFFCTSLTSTAADNLYLQKNCFPEAPLSTNEICKYPDKIAMTAEIGTFRTALKICATGLIVTLAGTWRDRTGQSKPLMMLSLCGDVLGIVVLMFGYYFWNASSWLIAIIEGIVFGTTGGLQLFQMAANCHIIENSTLETRSRRITYMVTAIFFALMLATACGGTILSALHYGYLFMLCVLLHITNLFLCKILVQDNVKESNEGDKLLNLRRLKTVFQRRKNNIGIWSMIFCTGFIFASITGEAPLFLLFLQKKFMYNVTQAGQFGALRLGIMTFGSIAMPYILSKLFKKSEYNLIIFGTIISGASALSMALIETETQLFICSVLVMFKATQLSAIKSTLTKFLRPEEIGLYSSFETITSAILPVAFVPLYSYIFYISLSTWPGAFYLLSVGFEVAVLLLAILSCVVYGGTEPGEDRNTECVKESDPEKGKEINESHSSVK